MTGRWNTTPANAHNIQPDCAFINRLYRADIEDTIRNLRSGLLALAFELDGVMADRQTREVNFLEPGRSIRSKIFSISLNLSILLDSWRVIQNSAVSWLLRAEHPASRDKYGTELDEIPTFSAIPSTDTPRSQSAPTSAIRWLRGVMNVAQQDKSQAAMMRRFRARSAPPPPLMPIFESNGRLLTGRPKKVTLRVVAEVEAKNGP